MPKVIVIKFLVLRQHQTKITIFLPATTFFIQKMPFHLSNLNKLKLTFRRKPMFISLSVHDHHDIHVISAHDLEERM